MIDFCFEGLKNNILKISLDSYLRGLELKYNQGSIIFVSLIKPI